jgi:hypothetical protein
MPWQHFKREEFALLVMVLLTGCATQTTSNKIYLGNSRLEVSTIGDRIRRVDGRSYGIDLSLDDYTCKVNSDSKAIMYCETRAASKECYCVMPR